MLLAGIRSVTEGVDFFLKMPLQGSPARSQGVFFIFLSRVTFFTLPVRNQLVADFQALVATHSF